ncbi:MAG: hypothetical protein IVW53_07755 [Chloroflexi bacterium]|nr:hypothetical protein [Chloroflexota bacterium]
MPVVVAFAMVIIVGLVATGVRPGEPSPASSLAAGGLGSPVAATAASITAYLDRSAADLQSVTTTARSGDPSALAAVLMRYGTDLAALEAELHMPGADLVTAGILLRSQAFELSTMASVIPAANENLFRQLTSDLDRLIASLANGKPPASPPGNGKPADAGNGKPTASPPGNGKPTASPPGNGNAAANGHAKAH